MIRRRMGSDWLLIPNAQRARAAALIAEQIGGEVAPLSDYASVRAALIAQDVAYQTTDNKPPLNLHGEPMGHDEIPLALLLELWASAASNVPRAQLLLSVLSLQRSMAIPAGSRNARERFLLNKHQQREIERQPKLREAAAITEKDPAFIYDYRMMLFAGQLATDLCTDRQRTYPAIPKAPGSGGDVSVVSTSASENAITLAPFPLKLPFTIEITGKRIPRRSFDHELELFELLESAESARLSIALSAG